MRIRLPSNGWRPRPYQWPLWDAWVNNDCKRNCAVWHRRAGKDDICLHGTAVKSQQRIGTYWHMLPEAAQARKAIWEAVNPHTGMRRIDEAFPLEMRAATRSQEMFIRFKNGSTWQVVGSDNFNSLVGSPPVGVVLSEWSLANPAAWAYLLPILTENGGWANFIYTPRGKNHGERTYKSALKRDGWFAELLDVTKTGAMTEHALAEALEDYVGQYGEDEGKAFFEQEYYCSFEAAILGAIYGGFMAKARREGRILPSIEIAPGVPVNTAWDIGHDDSTAIWWWQVVGTEVRLLDYHASSGKDPEYYCNILKGIEQPEKERGRFVEHYGKHYVPHDAANKLLAAGGRSIVAQARDDHGVDLTVVQATSQANQIAAARKTINNAWFDETRCEDGIDALTSYRYEWDERNRCFRTTPLHDWSSDGSDAFEIIGQVWRTERPKPEPEPTVWPTQQPIKHILEQRRRARLNG